MPLPPASEWTERITPRFMIVLFLVLVLLIPLGLVMGVADERQRYYREVVTDIAQSYGHAQSLAGPFLVVPAVDRVTTEDAEGRTVVRSLETQHVLLPDHLGLEVKVQHQYRARAIYRVPVFEAEVQLAGNLPTIDRAAVERAHHRVFWDKAYLVLGISDTRALRGNSDFRIAERTLPLMPGTGLSWLHSGVQVPLTDEAPSGEQPDDKEINGWSLPTGAQAPGYSGQPFEVTLNLAGTERFAALPVGNQNEINMRASWPHPKFEGAFLPASHEIGPDGFSARWEVTALARGVPQSFSMRRESERFVAAEAAVSLHEPVTQYTSVDRGLKYGVLFIALTFLAVLCFELLTGARLHLVQYGVVGVALVLFYLVLLSLSEHASFLVSYLVASAVIVAMLGLYARSITGSHRHGFGFALLQGVLYWTLYVLLQLEDYALLTGTTVLVVGLAALMFVTRTLHDRDRVVPSSAQGTR